MRLKFGVALVVTVVLFSTGLDLAAWGDSGFPKEELISLIASAADNLDSGNTEDALDQLLEAKGILASQIAALFPGEKDIVLGNLAFFNIRCRQGSRVYSLSGLLQVHCLFANIQP